MRIVQINATCGQGSTGKICLSISRILTLRGIENYILYSLGSSSVENSIKYCNNFIQKIQSLFEKLFGIWGFGAIISTKKLIVRLKRIKPDIVHLHNIHSHDCNLDQLFWYCKKNGVKVFWTFHDCWAFTGYCTYFDYVICDKWKRACHACPQAKDYSLFFDKSSKLFKKKKTATSGVDLTIITPSQWLGDLCKQSFLSKYPVVVINNGIDLSIFRPTEGNFRHSNNCENKFLLLGIANKWEKRKGLDVFIKLSKDLDDRFQIVLIGIDEDNERLIPDNIISIRRTRNQIELAEIYTTVDMLVNPTLEENFPTVNIESLACGTPVITYATGGSAEMLDDKSGIIIERNNYQQLLEKLNDYIENPYIRDEDCVNKAACFSQQTAYDKYIELYLNTKLHNN